VLVPAGTVRRVAVLIVDVVDMTGVLKLRVPAVLAVYVRAVRRVFSVRSAVALIPMRAVFVVGVAIVQVIDVSRVLNARVTARLVMLVRSMS
jgi:hypothetical protein